MNKTQIEWVLNPDNKTLGFTWNPITGCLNHTPDGLCLGGGFPCYAYRLAHGRLRHKYLANNILPTHDEPNHQAHHNDPFYPRFWPSRLYEPHPEQYQNPRTRWGIFICDMGEFFGDWLPYEWQRQIFDVINSCPQHRFYLLTKQPQNLIKWNPFPDNCFVGVTATNREYFTLACSYLSQIKATVKFISIEPLLQRIIFTEPGQWGKPPYDWLVIGAQTNPYKSPRAEWVKEIVEAADKDGIPLFLKNNLWRAIVHPLGIPPLWARGDGVIQDADILRQEMPAIRKEAQRA